MQEWDSSYKGVEVLSKALAEANSEEPLGQGRCTGFSGAVKAVKIKKSCSEGDCGHEHEQDEKIASKIEHKQMDFGKLER
jgi:hypothetical protein